MAVLFVAVPLWRCLCGGASVAVPLWRLKMTKIKTLRLDGQVDGRTGGITLRGPRGPKKSCTTCPI